MGWDAQLTIAGHQVNSPPTDDAVALVKIDRYGMVVRTPRTYDAHHVEVGVGPTGSIYLAGEYSNQVSFGDDPKFPLDAGVGDADIFVARLRP